MNTPYCQICKNLSDFTCVCSGKSQFFCYTHSKKHFCHAGLKFIPNRQTINNSRQLNEMFKTKVQELNQFIVRSQYIKDKCIQEIKSSYSKIELALRNSIKDIIKASDLISNLVERTEIIYLTAHSLLFKQNFPLIDYFFENFRDNYIKAEKSIKKLFYFKSYTKNLNSTIAMNNYDEEFNDRELERLKLKLRLKNLIKQGGSDSSSYRLLKINSIKDSLTYSFTQSIEDPTNRLNDENIFSLYSDKVFSYRIQDMEFTNEQFDYAIKNITNFKKIHFLSLINITTNEYQSHKLSDALNIGFDLVSLNIPNNCLCNQGLISILNKMGEYKRLNALNIQNNFIYPEGILKLSQILPTFERLMDLNLGLNPIGVEGAKYLRPALKRLMILEELRVNNCNLQTEGVIEIITGVMFLPHLCILDISVNQMYDEGGLFVSESLMHARALNKLTIDDNLSSETIDAVVRAANKICKVVCKGEDNRKVVKQYGFL